MVVVFYDFYSTFCCHFHQIFEPMECIIIHTVCTYMNICTYIIVMVICHAICKEQMGG